VMRRMGHARVVEDVPYGPVTELAGLAIKAGHSLKAKLPVACVDDDGVGGGVTDILQEEGYPVVPILGGSTARQRLPNGKPRFINRRSELYWNLREAFAGPSGTGEDGWLDLDPADDEMAAQLGNIKYRVNRHGQIEVETKEQMKKRGVDSPDRADALCYSVCPDEPAMEAHAQWQHSVTGDLLHRQW
jgi:hypothetical protein